MPIFPVPSGEFAGMLQADLVALRATAQAALQETMLGGRVMSAAYSQAEGSRSVSFQGMGADGLRQYIFRINRALTGQRRRAIVPFFR